MSSKSFDTQEVREIGRKEAEESRGFHILCVGIMEDVFQMEGKENSMKRGHAFLHNHIFYTNIPS